MEREKFLSVCQCDSVTVWQCDSVTLHICCCCRPGSLSVLTSVQPWLHGVWGHETVCGDWRHWQDGDGDSQQDLPGRRPGSSHPVRSGPDQHHHLCRLQPHQGRDPARPSCVRLIITGHWLTIYVLAVQWLAAYGPPSVLSTLLKTCFSQFRFLCLH